MAALTASEREQDNPILRQARKAAGINKAQPAPVAADSGMTVTSGTTESRRVSTKTQIDDPAASSFGDTISAIDAGLAAATKLTNELMAVKSEDAEVSEVALQAVNNSVTSKQVINTQQAQATMAAERDSKRVFDAMGGADRLTELATGRKTAVDDMLADQKKVQETLDIDPRTHFAAWLAGKFTIGGLEDDAAASTALVAKYDNAINNITGLASKADQTIDQMKTTVTDATLQASSNLLLQQATIDAAKFKQQANQSNAERVTTAMAMNKEQTTAQITKWQLGLQARSETTQKQERDLRRKALEKDERFQERLIDGAIEGRKAMGIPTYAGTDPAEILKERENIFTEYKIGGESAAKIADQFDVGIGMVAPTPYQTLKSLTISDPTKLVDGSNIALEALADATKTATLSLQEAGARVTEENLAAAVDSQFATNMQVYAENIKEGDASNPNRAVPISALITLADVKEEPLVVNVLQPLITEEGQDMEAGKVLELAFAAIKTRENPKGTINFEQAVEGIRTIYSKAVTYNNTSQDRERKGLPLQTNYNAKIKGRVEAKGKLLGFLPAGVTFDKAVNLIDPVEIRAAGVRALSAVRSKQDIGLLDLTNADEKQEK